MLLFLPLSSHAVDLLKIYNIIKHVESDNNVAAIGDNGKAYGIVQIHKICVRDINRIYGTSYTHQQAFNEKIAKEMFMLYIKAGIKLFIDKYNISPTEQDIVRFWNGGIYSGYKNKSTIKYWLKYKKYKKLLSMENRD